MNLDFYLLWNKHTLFLQILCKTYMYLPVHGILTIRMNLICTTKILQYMVTKMMYSFLYSHAFVLCSDSSRWNVIILFVLFRSNFRRQIKFLMRQRNSSHKRTNFKKDAAYIMITFSFIISLCCWVKCLYHNRCI